MTVLFFVRRFCPLIGGVETHVLQIGKRLVAQRWNVIVVTEESKDAVAATEIVEGIHVYRISVGKDDWFKKFRIWVQIWKVKKLIGEADIVHCHDVFFWYLPFRFFFWKKPVYTTFHGYETTYPLRKNAIFVRKLSEKLSWGNICVGDFIKKWYGTKATYITYGGVDKLTEQGQKNKKKSTILQILFIGRLEKDTGSNIYLKAFAILQRRKIAYNFNVYGDGSQRKQFEQYGTVHGFTKDLQDAIASAGFVFTSSYLSILQVMAQKKLVISVFENPLKEDYLKMAPFAKWIVIEKDSERLAEKIKYYVSHPKEKEALIEKAYQWSHEQSWDRVTDMYRSLWKING